MSSFFQNCDSADSSSSLTSTNTNGEHCELNVPRLVGVIAGFVGLLIIFSIAKWLRGRSSTNDMVLPQISEPLPAPWPSTQLIPPPPPRPPVYAYQQPAIYPNNAFSPPLAGPVQSNNQFHITVSPPASPDTRRTSGSWSMADDPYKSYHAAHRPHQQPVVQPNNVFPSPAPIQSNNRLHIHPSTGTASPPAAPEAPSASPEARPHHSRQQSVVQSDNTLPTPTTIQSNNPFLRYLVAENVSPPVSSEAQRETSQADSDPYDTHAVARRQQAAALAKYSRTSDSNQLSGSGASSSEPLPPPYTE
ncbi:hypothetical protein ARMGADRAFT_686231 [Armillaria gallica]|uniref:Uncharacterized protein n=1 Tax=Armillaria gallica TaxID=47427 RepID=A0A2H3CUF7_ARMGA|nr:hypothetical protein ARMGADRAFT_686231 [Armillaria gallica]